MDQKSQGLKDSKQPPGAPPSFEGQGSQNPPPPPFTTTFATVSMHTGDRLRLLGLGPDIQAIIRTCINQSWPGGVQSEKLYYGSHEYKLIGYPWYGTGNDAVHSRRLMNRILNALFNFGWVLNLSTDISKKVTDLDTLVFRHQIPPPEICDWMCIAFSNGDRLRLIDAPPDFTQLVIASFTRTGILQSHRPHGVPGCYELKMRGYPWLATGGETMIARQLILELMTMLESQGWTPYASIDQKAQTGSGNSQSGDSDTWHCCRRQSWSPGLPVYHN